jgi:DNA-binding transcriptional MerR regulator
MRIGELARRTGATTRALRYYEERGLLGPGRGTNGYRDYDPDAVQRVRNIRRLLEAGLSCDDIRELDGCLDRDLDDEPACADAIALYEQRLDTVRRRIDALVDVHRSLRTELDHLRSSS